MYLNQLGSSIAAGVAQMGALVALTNNNPDVIRSLPLARLMQAANVSNLLQFSKGEAIVAQFRNANSLTA